MTDTISTTSGLNPGQRDLLLTELFRPEIRSRLILTYRISGPLNFPAFSTALQRVTTAHESLRLRFSADPADAPRQWAVPASSSLNVLRTQSVRARSVEQFEKYARVMFEKDLHVPWDLSAAPPFRAQLMRFSPELHAFSATFANIAFDGTSRTIFERVLWREYAHALTNDAADSPPSVDFLACTTGHHARAAEKTHRHVRELVARMPAMCQFGAVRDTAEDDHVAGHLTRQLDGPARRAVDELCREHRCTPFQWIISALAQALFEQCVQDRIALYIPVDTRKQAETDVIGMFSESSLLVLDRGDLDQTGRVAQVRRATLDALMNRHGDPEVLREALLARGQIAGTPVRLNLIATYTDVSDETSGEVDGTGLTVDRDAFTPSGSASAGVTLRVLAFPDRFRLLLDYNSTLFTDEDAEALIGRIVAIVEGFPSSARGPRLPEHLVRITEPDGSTVMVIDPAATAAVLRTHPSVVDAEVFVRETENGSTVCATVSTVDRANVGELKELCYQAARESMYVVAPNEVTGLTSSAEEHVLRDKLVDVFLAVLPNSTPSDRFWVQGGGFDALRRVRQQAADEGLPVPEYSDFAAALTLRAIADRAVARAAEQDER